MRAKSNRIREGNIRRFQERRQFDLIFGQPCLFVFYVVCAYIEFFGEVGHFTERS